MHEAIAGGRHAKGAINVQSQVLAAPTAVMAEQAVIGLVEHPEQPITIDIANPGCRHKLWVPWQTSDVKVNGYLVRRASQSLPDIQTLPAAVDNLSAKPAVWPLSGVAPHRVRLSHYMATAYGVT